MFKRKNQDKEGYVESDCVLSNIGNVSCPENFGKFSIQNMFYTLSNLYGIYYYMFTVTTFRGKLNLGVCHSKRDFDDETLEKSLKRFEANIDRMINEQ